MDEEQFLTLELPYPDSKVTHTIFYKLESALEIRVFNLPLTDTAENLNLHLSDIFSIFGHVEEVSVSKDSRIAIVKFQSEKGLQRAISMKKKHQSIPSAVRGQFGVQRYLDRYMLYHPPIETLKKTAYDYIAEFEEKEKEMQQASAGRKVVRMTEAEQREIMDKYQQKAKRMQSSDFYAFQQKGRPTLASELLSNEIKPRHLKKIPKEKKKQQ